MSGYPRVRGVISRQGNDLSALTNEVADRYGFPPQVGVATHIMESGIDEYSERRGRWPDVSAGIDHQAVAWAPIGDQRTGPTGNNEVRNYPGNIEAVFHTLKTDVRRAVDIAGKQLGHWWRVTNGHPLNTLSKYNRPVSTIADNPNAANIRRAWAASARYVEGSDMAWQPDDVRDLFPYSGCDFNERSLSSIREVIYHHGASRLPAPTREAELALAKEYHNLHVGKGWCAISYHVVIGPSGTAYWCNALNLISYHATIANATAVGICFLGGFSNAAPSDVMITAAVQARRWVAQQCGKNDLPYRGHIDVEGGTACPGGWWPTPGRQLLATAPAPTPEPLPEPPAEDEVAVLRRELEWHVNTLGYLSGDVVQDMRASLATLAQYDSAPSKSQRHWQRRKEARAALVAAVDTVERKGEPAP